MSKIKQSILSAACMALVIGFTPSAQANMILELSSGGATVTVVDNGAADLDSDIGSMAVFGNVGAFKINIVGGLSKPLIGDNENAYMDLAGLVSTTNTSPGPFPATLTLKLTDTDFTLSGTGARQALSSVGGTTDGSVVFNSYLDNTNADFGEGTELSGFSFGPGAYSGSNAIYDAVVADPFSLTMVAIVTHTGIGQTTSFDYSVKVPEPATLVLMGLGLIGIGYASRKAKSSI